VHRARATFVAVALAAVVALGSVAAASGQPLTKKQFIKQADKICAAGDKANNALAEQYFGNLPKNAKPDPATVTAFWAAAKPGLVDQINAIDALAEPKADHKQVAKILAAVRAAIKKVDADPNAALSSNSAFSKADKLARQYGFKVCGSNN
jgi:hypothetical protein